MRIHSIRHDARRQVRAPEPRTAIEVAGASSCPLCRRVTQLNAPVDFQCNVDVRPECGFAGIASLRARHQFTERTGHHVVASPVRYSALAGGGGEHRWPSKWSATRGESFATNPSALSRKAQTNLSAATAVAARADHVVLEASQQIIADLESGDDLRADRETQSAGHLIQPIIADILN